VNILLVEANIEGPDISAAIKPDLKGCYIVTCFSGRAALDIIHRDFAPDIAVIDAALPDLNWLTLVDMLRLQPNHVYTIMMISRESGADPGLILEAGVDDYIFKPVDHGDLSYKLKKALQEKGRPDLLSGAPQNSPAHEINSGERIEALITTYGVAKERPADPAVDEQVPMPDSRAEQTQVEPASFKLLRPSINRFSEEAAVPVGTEAALSAAHNLPEISLFQTDRGLIQPKPKFRLTPQPKYLSAPLPEESLAEVAPAPAESEQRFESKPIQCRPVQTPPAPEPKPEAKKHSEFTPFRRQRQSEKTESMPVQSQPVLIQRGKQPRRPIEFDVCLRQSMPCLGNILLVAVLLLMGAVTFFLTQSRIDHGVAAIFSYQLYIARADTSAGRPGSLLITGEVGIDELFPGDIITTGSARQGAMAFYRVAAVNQDRRSVLAESGDFDYTGKLTPVDMAEITGKVKYTIPGAGDLALFSQTLAGLIALVLAPGLLIMALAARGIGRILFSVSSKNLQTHKLSLARYIIILLLAGFIISAASAAWLAAPELAGSGHDRHQWR